MRRCSRKFMMFLHNLCLEEKAKHIIANEVQMSNFEDIVRCIWKSRFFLKMSYRYIRSFERDAVSALNDADFLLNIFDVGDKISFDVISTFKDHVTKMESIMENELSLRFESIVIPKLRETCAFFNCGSKALIFRDSVPTLKEVELLLVDAKCYHVTYADRSFWKSLIDGFNWLKQAVEILGSCNVKRFTSSDVKEAWRQSKVLFPPVFFLA
ncbi:hypothetical protein Hanom_Chr00s009039g01742341 [Helianthus anomalus]